MLRVQRDEPGAFAELIERYRPKVFGRFFRLFTDRQDAEDLTQEVFLRLLRYSDDVAIDNIATVQSYFAAISGKDKPAATLNEYVADDELKLRQVQELVRGYFARRKLDPGREADALLHRREAIAVLDIDHRARQRRIAYWIY